MFWSFLGLKLFKLRLLSFESRRPRIQILIVSSSLEHHIQECNVYSLYVRVSERISGILNFGVGLKFLLMSGLQVLLNRWLGSLRDHCLSRHPIA